MPREMSSAMQAVLAASVVPLAIFAEATFASGPIRLWTGVGPIVWNGQTWTGLGQLCGMSPIEEGATVEARGIQLSLNGFDLSALALVRDEFQVGQPVKVYVGAFSGGALIADPINSWIGRMDAPTISVDGKTATISISCESRLVQLNVAVDRRYTNDDQQRDHPGDLGFSHVSAIQEVPIYWGKIPSTGANI